MDIIKTNFKYRTMTPRSLNQIDRIILHHAAAVNCSAEDIHNWHLARNWARCRIQFLG